MKTTTTALALAFAIAAVPAAAQNTRPSSQEKAPELRPSEGAVNAIIELQKAVNANNAATIPAKVAAAKAVAKTKDDKYIIGQLQLKVALATNDNAAMAQAIDTIAGSGYLDSSKVAGLYQNLGSTYYNAKQFDQAAAAFERAVAIDPRNAEPLTLLGEARNAQGRKADAVAAFQRAIQIKTATGQKPGEDLYKRAVGIAYDAKSPIAIELAREWVAAYPSGESWRNAIAIYRNTTHPDVGPTLDLLRLMRAAGALTQPADYNLYATAAAEQGNYGEAKAVIDEGIAAHQIDPASPLFRDIISGLKTKPMAKDADLVVAAKSTSVPATLIGIGDRYYGLGEYAKAVELYRSAMAKGADSNVANLHLGMALARSGDKVGATAALNAVTGPRADVAKYWLIYLAHA